MTHTFQKEASSPSGKIGVQLTPRISTLGTFQFCSHSKSHNFGRDSNLPWEDFCGAWDRVTMKFWCLVVVGRLEDPEKTGVRIDEVAISEASVVTLCPIFLGITSLLERFHDQFDGCCGIFNEK